VGDLRPGHAHRMPGQLPLCCARDRVGPGAEWKAGSSRRDGGNLPGETKLIKLPSILQETLHGCTPAKVRGGESGGQAYQFTRNGCRALCLKCGSGAIGRRIVEAAVRLHWLNEHLPSPRIRQFGGEGKSAWMLTAALPGRPASDCLATNAGNRPEMVHAIAGFMRRPLSLPTECCLF